MTARPKAVLPRGLQDTYGTPLALQDHILRVLERLYARYGFEKLATPSIEYADAIGKFLPDKDRPNDGVFGFKDDDGKWLVLRYDLTAPLARFVAENQQTIVYPFRRYQTGCVFRNEKPGPGRYREFIQFDADTVGAASVTADAEFCMLASDALEELGIGRGNYVVKVNSRKVLNGILDQVGVPAGEAGQDTRAATLRAMDKFDRLGAAGVAGLLGKGRKDESGDFTPGVGLGPAAIDRLLEFLGTTAQSSGGMCKNLGKLVQGSATGEEGIQELVQIEEFLSAAGYSEDRVRMDPSVVRGLGYYTGPIFEAELTFPVVDETGKTARFGSVGGGGRYDDLVERFLGKTVPATGFSIGVSRLAAALEHSGLDKEISVTGPVVVIVFERAQIARYQAMTAELRKAGIPAEMYVGDSDFRPQLKYADRRNAPVVIIEGEDERKTGEVTIKDMLLGKQLAQSATSRASWLNKPGAQTRVLRGDLVKTVQALLQR